MTFFLILFIYIINGDDMKVKVFDFEHELDLEDAVNNFIDDKNVIDIKYQVSISMFSDEQIYCFSAMILYNDLMN